MKAKLSKQQGYARANLFGLRKSLSSPQEAQLKAQMFDAHLQASGVSAPTRMAAFIKMCTERMEGASGEMLELV